MPSNTTHSEGLPPKDAGPPTTTPTPESTPPEQPTSPDTSSDVHGDPETPV